MIFLTLEKNPMKRIVILRTMIGLLLLSPPLIGTLLFATRAQWSRIVGDRWSSILTSVAWCMLMLSDSCLPFHYSRVRKVVALRIQKEYLWYIPIFVVHA